MIYVMSSFHSDSHRFVSFNNTSVFCLVFSSTCGRVPCCSDLLKFYKALLLASEFPTLYEHFHDILEFLIIRINEVNTRSFLALSSFGF